MDRAHNTFVYIGDIKAEEKLCPIRANSVVYTSSAGEVQFDCVVPSDKEAKRYVWSIYHTGPTRNTLYKAPYITEIVDSKTLIPTKGLSIVLLGETMADFGKASWPCCICCCPYSTGFI